MHVEFFICFWLHYADYLGCSWAEYSNSHTMLVVILMWHTLGESSAQIEVYCCSSQEPMAASLWGMECVLI